MNSFEVAEPILSSPFAEPRKQWYIREGEEPELREGRRPAVVIPPRDQRERWDETDGTLFPSSAYPGAYEVALVNLIRERVADWRRHGDPGATRTTLELLHWWGREGRQRPLFFAQHEAAETILFLTVARADFLQGVNVPRDEPGDDQREKGFTGFRRYACKVATGAGKTTVMGMLAAWSILNKVNDHSDARFSDVVLVVCHNVTIRGRLRELDPREGDASIYRTRDLVPAHLLPTLTQGHVLVMNWHVFEPQSVQVAGDSARVVKAGRPALTRETITLGAKTTTARGTRYLTREDVERQVAAGLLTVLKEQRDKDGGLKKVEVESYRYVESDTALVNRLLGREVGGKRNVLVMNDEAHHAYRIRRPAAEGDEFDDEEEAEEFVREATVWVEGLDRIHKLCGINCCIDLSATPYYLGRWAATRAGPSRGWSATSA
jgi:type III restriction enzyme